MLKKILLPNKTNIKIMKKEGKTHTIAKCSTNALHCIHAVIKQNGKNATHSTLLLSDTMPNVIFNSIIFNRTEE